VRPVSSKAVEVMKFEGYRARAATSCCWDVGSLELLHHFFLMGARSFRLRFGLVGNCVVWLPKFC